jgi:hypothetical protein
MVATLFNLIQRRRWENWLLRVGLWWKQSQNRRSSLAQVEVWKRVPDTARLRRLRRRKRRRSRRFRNDFSFRVPSHNLSILDMSLQWHWMSLACINKNPWLISVTMRERLSIYKTISNHIIEFKLIEHSLRLLLHLNRYTLLQTMAPNISEYLKSLREFIHKQTGEYITPSCKAHYK